MENRKKIDNLKHHEQGTICPSRASYRQGRKDTAVKVYTVNQESKYLLAHGVPAVGCGSELEDLCNQFGFVEELKALNEYPAEQFTEVYCVKYSKLVEARFAKRKLDNRSFFGGVLHVCYAPELESVQETREKLQERRRLVIYKTRSSAPDHYNNWQSPSSTSSTTYINPETAPSASSTEPEMITYVWAGKTYTVPANPAPVNPSTVERTSTQTSKMGKSSSSTTTSFIPNQLLKRKIGTESSVDASTSNINSILRKTAEPARLVMWKRKKTS